MATIADRLRTMQLEITDLMDCAEDMGWTPVTHKLQEAEGKVENALTAALQAEERES